MSLIRGAVVGALLLALTVAAGCGVKRPPRPPVDPSPPARACQRR